MSEPKLETLSADEFRKELGKTFRIHADDSTVDAKLVEVSDVKSHTRRPDRAPFSVLFEGPPDRPLPQRMYTLENDGMGEIVLFLVTLGPDADGNGMIYEAVFT